MVNLEKNNWFNKEIENVEKILKTNIKKGLKSEDVAKRQEEYGLNELKAKKKKTVSKLKA